MGTARCSCLVSNCKFFGKTEFADIRFIIYHLKRHSYNELRLAAIENKIIAASDNVQKDWLVREVARACTGVYC